MSTQQPFDAKKFQALKKRLDSLNYCFPLSIDSAQLAEKLLNEIVKITEGFQQMKKQKIEFNDKYDKSLQINQECYQQILSITNENNQYRQDIMKLEEQITAIEISFNDKLVRSDQDQNDLKEIIIVKDKAINRLEVQNQELKKQLQSLNNNKENHEIPSNQHLVEGEIDQQNRMFEASRALEIGDLQNSIENKGDQKILEIQQDELKAQKKQIDQLSQELQRYLANKQFSEEKMRLMYLKLENREGEIRRLIQNVEKQGNYLIDQKVNGYEQQQQIEKEQRLERQVDLLSKENHEITKQLEQFRYDIKNINQIKQSKDSIISNLNKQVLSYQKKFQQIESQVSQRDQTIDQLKNELSQHRQKQENEQQLINQELKSHLQDKQTLIEQLLQDKYHLESQSSQAKQVVGAYQSDKKMFVSTISKVNEIKQQLEQQIIEKQQEIDFLKFDKITNEERISSVNGKYSYLQRELQILEASNKQIIQELEQQISTYKEQAKQSDIQHQEYCNFMNQQKLTTKEFEELKKQVERLEQQISEQRYTIKNLEVSNQQLGLLNTQNKSDKDILNNEKMHMKKGIENLESTLQQKEQRIKELLNTNLEIKRSSKQTQERQNELIQKINELEEQNKQQTENNQDRIEKLIEENNAKNASLDKLNQELKKLQFENSKQEQNIENLKYQNKDYVNQIQQKEESLFQLKSSHTKQLEELKQIYSMDGISEQESHSEQSQILQNQINRLKKEQDENINFSQQQMQQNQIKIMDLSNQLRDKNKVANQYLMQCTQYEQIIKIKDKQIQDTLRELKQVQDKENLRNAEWRLKIEKEKEIIILEKEKQMEEERNKEKEKLKIYKDEIQLLNDRIGGYQNQLQEKTKLIQAQNISQNKEIKRNY